MNLATKLATIISLVLVLGVMFNIFKSPRAEELKDVDSRLLFRIHLSLSMITIILAIMLVTVAVK